MSYDQYEMPGKLRWANYRLSQSELSVRFWTEKEFETRNKYGENPIMQPERDQLRRLKNMLKSSVVEYNHWKSEVNKLQTRTLFV